MLLLVWSVNFSRSLAPFFYQGFFYGAGMDNNAEASSDSCGKRRGFKIGLYEAQENFRQEGLGGLLPQKRGPKKARKLTPEVRLYLEEQRLQRLRNEAISVK